MLRLNTAISAILLLLIVDLAMANTPSQPPHQLFYEGDLKLESGEVFWIGLWVRTVRGERALELKLTPKTDGKGARE